VRGEHTRLVPVAPDELWPALERALDGEGFTIAHADRGRGVLATRTRRYADKDLLKRLPQIGDLSALRGNIGGVSELLVAYYLVVRPGSDAGTRLTVRSTIEAVARETVFLGPGLFDIVPHHVPIPSRGVLERELLRRLGGTLFTAEEMLFLLGEPGVD
jgi:hypothetical protein